MPKLQVVLGIDIGGTNTKFGYVDRKGRCLTGTSTQTDAHQPAGQFFDQLQKNAGLLLETIDNLIPCPLLDKR